MNTPFDIAFDISFLPTTGGFGTHTAQSLKNFIRFDAQRNYLLLENHIPPSIPQYQNQAENRKARWQPLPEQWRHVQTSRHSRIAWMLWDLPRLLQELKPRLFHSLDNVTVPRRLEFCQTVSMIHDMIPISHPQYCRRRDTLAAKWLFGRTVKYSDKIITVSQYSANQILRYFPTAEDKLVVIEDGVDHDRFSPAPNRDALASDLAQKYQLYSPVFWLIVTTLSPRRNLNRFLRAYATHIKATQDRESCLVIAGCRGWKDHDSFQLIQSLNLSHRVHFLDFLPDDELVRLFQSAYALAQPSLLEGFGLTVLEAMACGTPVLCSSTTALGETAGDAALKVDPENESALARAIITLGQDPTLHKELSAKGLTHAQQYRWDETTKRVIALFDQMIR
ncbi:MAG: glycosyltransferase family 1 protein [bacterium]|jgi:alpha-1,3-rhamnosyl/mannosyltransferase|nr:glycosyltransferase family 1 protein [bacterium]